MSEGYRRCCTGNCWVGAALALRILKLEQAWAHDAFLDYVDRWMTEDEKAFRQEITKYTGNPLSPYAFAGNLGEAWIGELWKKYRTADGRPPTDGWKTLKANPGGWQHPPLQGLDPNAKPAEKKASTTPTEAP